MDTAGWDTISALGIERANRLLRERRDGLVGEVSANVGTGAPLAYTLEGSFGPWRIVEGGAAELLHLELPFESGTLRTGAGADERKCDLGGVAVRLEVALGLLPCAEAPEGPGAPAERELRFDVQTVGAADAKGGPGVVRPLQVLDPEDRLGPVERALLPGLVAEALVERRAALAFSFAQVNLVAPGADSWLAPVRSSCAYLQTRAGQGHLAILSATSERDVSGLSRRFDPGAALSAHEGYFAVSQDLFLERVVLPRLPSCYKPGTRASSFRYDAGAHRIRNRGALACKPVRSGLITYYPKVDALELLLEGATLRSIARGECDMGLGITLHYTVDARSSASFDAKRRTLHFAPDPKPKKTHRTDIPWYVHIATGFLSLAAPLILNVVVAAIANDIAAQLSAELAAAPPIDESPWVRWGDLGSLRVETAGVDHGLFLAGGFGD